jgi:hypothetical protein
LAGAAVMLGYLLGTFRVQRRGGRRYERACSWLAGVLSLGLDCLGVGLY